MSEPRDGERDPSVEASHDDNPTRTYATPERGAGYPAAPVAAEGDPYAAGPAAGRTYPAHAAEVETGYGYAHPRNSFGVAALVLGIVALLISWIPGVNVLSVLMAIVAIILGALGSSRARRGIATNRGTAITGLVLGIISIVVSIAVYVLVYAVFKDCVNVNNPSTHQTQQCVQNKVRYG